MKFVKDTSLHQQRWRHKNGINKRYNSTPEEIGDARDLRRQGYCLQDIADMLGKKLSTIAKQCRDIKIGYAPIGSVRLEKKYDFKK